MRLSHEVLEGALRRFDERKVHGAIEQLKTSQGARGATMRQIERRRAALLAEYGRTELANRRLERILKGNDLTDINYLRRGLAVAKSVGRVIIRDERHVLGYGTGFLVAPGVLMTNQHVIENVVQAGASSVQFAYERGPGGADPSPVEFRLSTAVPPIILKELDFSLVAVTPTSESGRPLDEFGWLRLSPEPGKAFVGEYLTIIQHPGGEPKQLCVRENRLLKYDANGPFLWYETDTTGGSSGSPVFNDGWEVVALHHSGVPETRVVDGQTVWMAVDGKRWTPEMGDDRIHWIANEGIRVSSILAYLRSQQAGHPLARLVLEARTSPHADAPLDHEGAWGAGPQTVIGPDGTLRIRLPIEVGVKVNLGAQPRNAAQVLASEPTIAIAPAPPARRVIEKVVIDPNYDERPGYQPDFLGANSPIPLPQLTKHSPDLLKIDGNAELRYWTYSVLFNKARRLAYVSAANVDPSRWLGSRDADGDTWYKDSRFDKELQLGAEFYKKQKTFEADRSQNPFDQGHLTRRSDVQWGEDEDEAKRNGDDSYHYTNCSPQHWAFNQDNKENGLWFRLEEYAANASNGGRLCIFNGPVFDAPLCIAGPDGRLRLNPKGKRVKDGTFGGVQIPKQFFKVFAYRKGQALTASAFIVTQEDLLQTIDNYYPEEKKFSSLTDPEVRLYQVPLTTVSALTGIDFGPALEGADTHESTADALPAALEGPESLRF